MDDTIMDELLMKLEQTGDEDEEELENRTRILVDELLNISKTAANRRKLIQKYFQNLLAINTNILAQPTKEDHFTFLLSSQK